jgi:hypothetical protein
LNPIGSTRAAGTAAGRRAGAATVTAIGITGATTTGPNSSSGRSTTTVVIIGGKRELN